jgi:predicted dithiol-disulfide oxidoreductase (DUF899 family)
MTYRQTAEKLAGYRREIAAIRDKMRTVQATVEPEDVPDYEFTGPTGPIRLSDLFGHHRDLIAIHNMGKQCPYCTLWADGYNGILEHIATRAAFVITSPDPPAEQQAFAASRGWRFTMVSHAGTTFAADMGYRSKKGSFLPGVSVFRRTAARIQRVADAGESPGDDFCTLWHLFDLFPDGAGDWTPKIRY